MKKTTFLVLFMALACWVSPSLANNFSTTLPIIDIPGDSYYPSDSVPPNAEAARQSGVVRSWYSVVWGGPYVGTWNNRHTGSGGHSGVDLRYPVGRDVLSVADGQVVYTGLESVTGGWGNLIIIKHTNQADNENYWSVYAHLDNFDPAICKYEEAIPGTHTCGIVTKGQKIGESGESGPTDPHLHFQVERSYGGNLPFFNYSQANNSAEYQNVRNETFDPISFCLGVGHFSDGWHYMNICPIESNPSQQIADAYMEYATTLGAPMDNGGTEYVHILPRDPFLPDLYGQDFDGGMIVINESVQKAYAIVKGFAWAYRGGTYVNPDGSQINIWGPNDLGTPTSVEMLVDIGESEPVIRQYFEFGVLTYRDNNPTQGQPGTISIDYGSYGVPGDAIPVGPTIVETYGSGGNVPEDLTGFGGGGPVPFPPPTNLVANPLGSSQIEARWDLVQDAVNYQISIYDHSSGNFINTLSDTDGSVTFTGLTAATSYELEAKAIYLDGESNPTSRVITSTLIPSQVSLESAELLTCESVDSLACTNPRSEFPYTPTGAYVYLKLANAYTDPLYFRFDLYDPSNNLAESFDRYGNYSGNPETEWVTYANLTGRITSYTTNRSGEWRIEIHYGYDINSITNAYTTYYFTVADAPPPPADVPWIQTEVVW